MPVFSSLTTYSDAGALRSTPGAPPTRCARSDRPDAGRTARDCATTPVPADELRRAKDHLKGSLMLSLESTSSRMSQLARQEMYFGRQFTLDEMLRRDRGRVGRGRAARGGRSVPRRRGGGDRRGTEAAIGRSLVERLEV